MNKKPKPKFAMEFVGFASYSDNMTEASIALVPDFDIVGVTSMVTDREEGSRVVTLLFQRSEKKVGRRGYSLKQEWENTPKTVSGEKLTEVKK